MSVKSYDALEHRGDRNQKEPDVMAKKKKPKQKPANGKPLTPKFLSQMVVKQGGKI